MLLTTNVLATAMRKLPAVPAGTALAGVSLSKTSLATMSIVYKPLSSGPNELPGGMNW